MRFTLIGGEEAYRQSAQSPLESKKAGAIVEDKGYDADAIRDFLDAARM